MPSFSGYTLQKNEMLRWVWKKFMTKEMKLLGEKENKKIIVNMKV